MRKTIFDLLAHKGKQPVSMLTAYDYHTACIMDEADIDMILVGDSLGNVMLGYENTLAVTVDDMIHHHGPLGAARNAGRIVKETN